MKTFDEDDWNAVERQLVGLINAGDSEAAIKRVNEVLSSHPAPGIASAALSWRALVKEDLGDLFGVLADLRKAHRLSIVGTHHRYTLELTIGGISKALNELGESKSWYLEALRTVLSGKGLSGGSALRSLCELPNGERNLSAQERSLCEDAVRASWNTLRQPGAPDLASLRKLSELLLALERQPLQRTDG